MYIARLKKSHIKTSRLQFYRATVHTVDGKKRELQVVAPPISTSLETDVQMIRYDNIRSEFTVGRETPYVQLGKDAHVHLYSPSANGVCQPPAKPSELDNQL